jgi:N-carbamoylputrescine amidase
MYKTRVAALAINGLLGNPQQNLDAIAHWSKQAKDAGADLALFPELVVHGHCAPDTWYQAEPVPDGPSTERLCRISRDLDLFLSVGLSEKEHDIVYNTQVLTGPSGFIGAQRKLHMSRDEALFYTGAKQAPAVFDIGKCRVGTSICFDGTFPEVSRILALHGADVLLMPHAARMTMWTDDPESVKQAAAAPVNYFTRLYAARAYENACFAVVCNQAGRAGYVDTYPKDSENQPHHAGGCVVFDPLGDVVAQTGGTCIREEMLIADLAPEKLWEARSKPNYALRHRRPELYKALSE